MLELTEYMDDIEVKANQSASGIDITFKLEGKHSYSELTARGLDEQYLKAAYKYLKKIKKALKKDEDYPEQDILDNRLNICIFEDRICFGITTEEKNMFFSISIHLNDEAIIIFKEIYDISKQIRKINESNN